MAQYDGQQVAFAQGRYRIERFWGCLPEDRQLGIISTLAVGSDGTLFVAQRNGPPVLVFAPDGQLRDIWPEHTAADPHGISVARTETSGPDRILLVDRDAHQVLLCSTQGEVLLALGERHRPRFQAPFNHPTSAAQAADGDIYVADGYGNTVVHRFDSGGRLLSTWGCPGDGPGAVTTRPGEQPGTAVRSRRRLPGELAWVLQTHGHRRGRARPNLRQRSDPPGEPAQS